MNKFHSKVLILVFMWSAVAVYATAATALQDTVPQTQDSTQFASDHIYDWVEERPMFTGGDMALRKWLAQNIMYPFEAVERNIQGSVLVKFVVEKDGSITNVEVLKGVHALLDEEALRVVRSMSKWVPGKVKGKAVRSYFTQPIRFLIR